MSKYSIAAARTNAAIPEATTPGHRFRLVRRHDGRVHVIHTGMPSLPWAQSGEVHPGLIGGCQPVNQARRIALGVWRATNPYGLTLRTLRELAECVEQANLDPAVHVIALAGNGGSWSQQASWKGQ